YTRRIEALPGVKRLVSVVNLDPGITLAQYQQLYTQPSQNLPILQAASALVNGDVTKITVYLQPADHTAAAIALVDQIRALSAPGGLVPLVDGLTPEQIDLLAALGATLPLALCMILLSVFVLLFWMTGSFVIPIKATLLNILSLSATFGGLVWIFQDGHLQGLLHFQSVGSIDATQPVLIFAIAFGLSMDYEVFLLSRIKECFDQTGDNRLAVASGLQRTGWLITSEALLLAIVLGAFGTARSIFIQEIGVGLASAIIMDATLIRLLLVPATMRLLGNFNWWAPQLPHWLRLVSISTSAVSQSVSKTTFTQSIAPMFTLPQYTTEVTPTQLLKERAFALWPNQKITTTPTQLDECDIPDVFVVWEQNRLESMPTQPMDKLVVPRAFTLRERSR
ncbi:MAG: MMPL family transporter, partial [Ktedonobacteraceae bacterium]